MMGQPRCLVQGSFGEVEISWEIAAVLANTDK